MSAPEPTAAVTVPLEQFRERGWILRMRWRVALTCLALFGGWWAFAATMAPRHRMMAHSPGELARVHATWDDRCEACHQPMMSVNSESWGVVGRGEASRRAVDAKCEACHLGPAHHQNQAAAAVPSCGACHLDHQGRGAYLTRIADAKCLDCHSTAAALAAKSQGGASKLEPVSGFPAGHPLFDKPRTKPTDPGKIAFNHKLHLTPGCLGDDPRVPSDGTALEQLTCASCHVAEPGGAGMLPVKYEVHCQKRHALGNFDAARPALAVPHGMNLSELKDALFRSYAGETLRAKPELATLPRRPSPQIASEEATAATQQIEAAVAKAQERLLARPVGAGGTAPFCGKCHEYAVDSATNKPVSVLPSAIPNAWMTRSRFDHSAHRAVDCKSCHALAESSTVSSDLLVSVGPEKGGLRQVGLALCVQCHSPARESGGVRSGGAAYHCTECHNYHHADDPAAGRGSPRREPKVKIDAETFLHPAP